MICHVNLLLIYELDNIDITDLHFALKRNIIKELHGEIDYAIYYWDKSNNCKELDKYITPIIINYFYNKDKMY